MTRPGGGAKSGRAARPGRTGGPSPKAPAGGSAARTGRRTVPAAVRTLLLSVLPAVFLIVLPAFLTGCGPWDDAVALVESLRNPEPFESEPEPEPEPTPAPTAEGSAPIDALGAVVSGDCPWCPGRSVSGWLLDFYPGGDWSCTRNTVDYWSVDPEDGGEVHFGFSVSPDGSFALDVCELDGEVLTAEELAERFS